MPDMKKRAQGTRNQRAGDLAEKVVMHRLRVAGVEHVRKLHTGMVKARGAKGYVHARKVDADLYGIRRGDGRGVLVEVKARADALSLSDMEPHQRRNLTDWAECGGLALLAWYETKSRQVFLMDWSKCGLQAGAPLRPNTAAAVSIKTVLDA